MHDWQSLSHVRWDCKYHVVIVPKYRKKVIYVLTVGKLVVFHFFGIGVEHLNGVLSQIFEGKSKYFVMKTAPGPLIYMDGKVIVRLNSIQPLLILTHFL